MSNQSKYRGYILTATAYKNLTKNWQGSFQVFDGKKPVTRQVVDHIEKDHNFYRTQKESAENALIYGAAWIDGEISEGRLLRFP